MLCLAVLRIDFGTVVHPSPFPGIVPARVGLTSYPYRFKLGSNVYPRANRTVGTLAGNAGPADTPDIDPWFAAWAGDRTCHPANFRPGIASRTRRSLSCAPTP